jgi:DNA-binding transcriptional LysR family regulator
MTVVCSPRHLLAGRESITLSELDGINMVGYSDDLPIRREIDRNLAACHVAVKIVMEFDNVETIKRAIEIDAGVGLLPEPTVAREVALGTLTTIPLAGDGLVRPLGIIRRRGKELGKTARRFIQLLHERAQEDSQGPSNEAPSSATELVGAVPRVDKRPAPAPVEAAADAGRA